MNQSNKALREEVDKLLEASPTDKEVPESIWNDLHPTWTGLWTDSWGEWDEILAGDLFPIKDLIGDERAEWPKDQILALVTNHIKGALLEKKQTRKVISPKMITIYEETFIPISEIHQLLKDMGAE